MSKLYAILGAAICLLLAYSNARGMILWNSLIPGHYEHREAGVHHK